MNNSTNLRRNFVFLFYLLTTAAISFAGGYYSAMQEASRFIQENLK